MRARVNCRGRGGGAGAEGRGFDRVWVDPNLVPFICTVRDLDARS